LTGQLLDAQALGAEQMYVHQPADCGIANVNSGTSGAEIGGTFGNKKETGGEREFGPNSWKAHMRRQTSTVFYGQKPPDSAHGTIFGAECRKLYSGEKIVQSDRAVSTQVLSAKIAT
jgi:hypothetical protein